MFHSQTIFDRFHLFLYSKVNLHPPFIVNPVIMIAGRRNCRRIKLRIRTNSRSRHETASWMSVNPHLRTIYERITGCQLLNRIFIIRQRIVALLAISIGMISLSPYRSTASMPNGYHNKSQLCQTSIIIVINCETRRHILIKRSGIDIWNNRIHLGRIEIRRFPHNPIKVCNPIGGFHFKPFRCFPSQIIHRSQIRFLQCHNHLPLSVTNHIHRLSWHGRVWVHHIASRRRDMHIMRCVFRSQFSENIRTIKLRFIKNIVIRINPFLTTKPIKVHFPPYRINLRDRTGYPSTVSQLILQASRCCIIQVIMSPSGAFGTEQDFFSII